MSAAAIIVAAGQGRRAGTAEPKQFKLFLGRPLFAWSVDAFRGHPEIGQVVVVVPSDGAVPHGWEPDLNVQITAGGATRTASVQAGLARIEGGPNTKVLIHDAARPGLSASLITELLAALDEADAAAPGLAVVDALKREAGGRLVAVDRTDLYRVQTPQGFRLQAIRAALEGVEDLVDDLAAIERANGRVRLVPGRPELGKITYPEDFEQMARLLAPAPRIGSGFDVHAFGPGDRVLLCGVEIPHDQGLAGHSDADVAWHALTDAILGAAALGDIGDHFPPSDPKWAGAASEIFLKHAAGLAAGAGYAIANVDVTVICEAPKVKPHREAMRANTARVLGVPMEAVSVKATTTEKLGFTGRREGVAAQAIAALSPAAIGA